MDSTKPSVIVGIPKETFGGERRVAVIPAAVASLKKTGFEVIVEAGAGEAAGYRDEAYRGHGALVEASRDELFARAEVIFHVRFGGANPEAGRADLARVRPGQVFIGLFNALLEPGPVGEYAERGATVFALELMPRISRAQSMDPLSAMATLSGYKAAILAAQMLPRLFPIMMTAAGTLFPARVFVIGAGVAGLQAIATARRLGADVEAYDVRPEVEEQVRSLGARFRDLDVEPSAASGGYAQERDEAYYERQRARMGAAVAESNVVIATASVPGKKAPTLLTADMIGAMAPGSVIVDLAAEQGGNCELTRPDETVVHKGVTIVGPTNLPATMPYHASQMYSTIVTKFHAHLRREDKPPNESEDEIVRCTLVAHNGEITNRDLRARPGLSAVRAGVEDGSQ